MSYVPRLKQEYNSKVISNLKEEFGYKNVMQVPKLKKIVISKGVGAAVSDKKLIDYAIEEVTNISGQKAISTISKKDVATFKLRKGMPIGVKVTLRGERMFEFLDRLVTSALPRVRDFNGIKSTGFDGRGNYNLGITEQIIFPEINIDKVNNRSVCRYSSPSKNTTTTISGTILYFSKCIYCRPIITSVKFKCRKILIKSQTSGCWFSLTTVCIT